MVGVWIAPVTAQVMMTFRLAAMKPPSILPRYRLVADILGRAPLVLEQRHEAPVAPDRPRGELALLQALAPVALDFVQGRSRPLHRPHLRWRQALIDALVAQDIVAHALRRVEVDGLEGPHEAPAQCQ